MIFVESLKDFVKRPFRTLPPKEQGWKDQERLLFLDSIVRGYPIGVFLLWHIERGETVVLDGRERINTLRLAWEGVDKPMWVFNLTDPTDLGPIRFFSRNPEKEDVPVETLVDTIKLNRWIRSHEQDLYEEQCDFVTAVSGRLREYLILSHQVTVQDDETALEICKRINRR